MQLRNPNRRKSRMDHSFDGRGLRTTDCWHPHVAAGCRCALISMHSLMHPPPLGAPSLLSLSDALFTACASVCLPALACAAQLCEGEPIPDGDNSQDVVQAQPAGSVSAPTCLSMTRPASGPRVEYRIGVSGSVSAPTSLSKARRPSSGP